MRSYVMNDDFVNKMKQSRLYIYGDNHELVAEATPEILAEFLNATGARHFSHHFDPGARRDYQPQAEIKKTAPAIDWDNHEGPVYGDNHELVAILPPKMKL